MPSSESWCATSKDEIGEQNVTARRCVPLSTGLSLSRGLSRPLASSGSIGGAHMPVTATDDEFTRAWQANRPYLVNLAFGMLGDIGAAEDAVQEAFARFSTADRAAIKDTRGWLIVVTSRVCLDQIGSARVRRERAVDT